MTLICRPPTAREMAVLRAWVDAELSGGGAKDVAREMGLSVATVFVHLRAARGKLGASTNLEAAAKAGILPVSVSR